MNYSKSFENIVFIFLLYFIIIIIAITLGKELIESTKINGNNHISKETKELIKKNYDGNIITLKELIPTCKELLKFKGITLEIYGEKFNSSNSIHDFETLFEFYLSDEQPFELQVKDEEEYIIDFFGL